MCLLKDNRFEMTSPNIAPLQWPTCRGPVGLADTNSTKYLFLSSFSFTPNVSGTLIILFIKFVQKNGFNFMLINPGLAIEILSIYLSRDFIFLDKLSARSKGGLLFILEITIATFVDISQSNFSGGISALILSND